MSQPRVSRRQALGLTGGLAAGLIGLGLTGCSGRDAGPTGRRAGCVPRSELERRTRLAELPLVYEVSGNRNAFWFAPDFATRLELWLSDLRGHGLRPGRLWTYGAWTDGTNGGSDGNGACGSWHNAGRAFDLARIERTDASFVSCRFDQWRSRSGAPLQRAQREYWAVAASLHRRFAYVVCYPYNEAHHNHIHVDNSRSGDEDSTFNPSSPTQVQALQAINTYVFDRPVTPTGRFDAATRRASEAVLDELGGPASVTANGGWERYLEAAAARITD